EGQRALAGPASVGPVGTLDLRAGERVGRARNIWQRIPRPVVLFEHEMDEQVGIGIHRFAKLLPTGDARGGLGSLPLFELAVAYEILRTGMQIVHAAETNARRLALGQGQRSMVGVGE